MLEDLLPEESEQSSRVIRDGDSSSSFSLRFLLAAMALFAVSMSMITWVWPNWKSEQLQILFTMICAWCVATAGWLFIVLRRRRRIVQQLGALQHRIGGRYNSRKESDLSAAAEASIAFCIWIAAIALVIQLELDEKGPAYVWMQTTVLTVVYIWYESRALQGLLLRPGKWELYERGLRAPRVGIRCYKDIESTELIDEVPETLFVRFAGNGQRPAILTIATEEESLEWLEWTLRRRMNELREESAAASAAASETSGLAPGVDVGASQFAKTAGEPKGPQFSVRGVLLILLLYGVGFMFVTESARDWDESQLFVFLALIIYWSFLVTSFVYRRWRRGAAREDKVGGSCTGCAMKMKSGFLSSLHPRCLS